MKHMWSEEELQTLIEEQGGSGGQTLENIVDSKGNKRFIGGNGNPEIVSGMSIASSKWTLNGNNLMFEILGTFSNSLSGENILCKFTIPEWIISKIATPYNNIIDFIRYDIISTTGSAIEAKVQITIDGSNIFFTNVSPTTVNGLSMFKIRYNTIIDSE